jgi:hypothetical protein
MWPYVGWVDSDVSKIYLASIFRVMWFKERGFLDLEHESNTILQNVVKYLPNDTASRTRGLHTGKTTPTALNTASSNTHERSATKCHGVGHNNSIC